MTLANAFGGLSKMRVTSSERPRIGSVFAPPDHDHAVCVRDAIHRAEEACARKRMRLTALRRRILEIVWMSHRPIGAYGILARLARERRGAAPPTVYRSLHFLLELGLIHRIQSLNAYVGCTGRSDRHASQFLICGRCGSAAELSDAKIADALAARARRLRFAVHRQIVEIEGLCAGCRAKQPG